MGNSGLAHLVLAAFALLASTACGSSTTGNGTDAGGGVDATTQADVGADTSLPVDAAPDLGAAADAPVDANAPFVCNGAPCTGTDVCCVTFGDAGAAESCQPSCGDGGAVVNCSGPNNCTVAAPFCCATITLTGGTLPTCNIGSVSATCSATCADQFAFSCTATDTGRLCRVGADCASDTNNPNCCDLQGNGASATLCVSNGLKQLGLTCHP
jgi:hypothetical protein